MAGEEIDERSAWTPVRVREVYTTLRGLGVQADPDFKGELPGYTVFIPMELLRSKEQLEALMVAVRRLQLMAPVDDGDDD
jgi:hypothetical protein